MENQTIYLDPKLDGWYSSICKFKNVEGLLKSWNYKHLEELVRGELPYEERGSIIYETMDAISHFFKVNGSKIHMYALANEGEIIYDRMVIKTRPKGDIYFFATDNDDLLMVISEYTVKYPGSREPDNY